MATRRSRKKSGGDGGGWIAGGVLAVLIVPGVVAELVRDHPVAVALVAFVVVIALAGAVYLKVEKARRFAEYERNVAVTDGMSGTEFEHYMARLMRRSGFRGVRVSGRAGDMGCDVVGYTPDGHKVVVQCKRYSNKLASGDVQKFAGTARDIHRADFPLLVTTAHVTNPARDIAGRCNILLVDRTSLAQWATTLTPPISGWPDRKRGRAADRQPSGGAAQATSAMPPGPRAASAASTAAGPPAASSPPVADWWNDHTTT
ncbi:restriction endonuclease [Actinoplanes solisilvae]|uniref:restriction endonuclease n=1 Tax=Actinoplanes solisilvae TaxID=2486853 RepID=UPI000FD9D255|nr:restriction endonuclease [Actinoplanes solisilvae]